jgi:hypothetical protein
MPKVTLILLINRGDILVDLRLFGNSHDWYRLLVASYDAFYLSGPFRDTFMLSAWHLIGLTNDISRVKTHFLAITLRRTTSSTPRTMYSLVDADVIQWSVLDTLYANRADFLDRQSPVSPRALFETDEEIKRRDGALGSVMVMTMELPKGDNRTPLDALNGVRIRFLISYFTSQCLIYAIIDERSWHTFFGYFQIAQRHPLPVGEWTCVVFILELSPNQPSCAAFCSQDVSHAVSQKLTRRWGV